MEDLGDSENLVVSTLPLFIVGILGFLLGLFSMIMQSTVFKWLGIDRSDISCYHKDIVDIKKTSLQIAQEWIEMTKLIKGIQDYQASFVDHFQLEFQAKCEALGQDIRVSLNEGFSSSNDFFARLKRTVEAMQEDVVAIKICLLSVVERSDSMEGGKKVMVNSAVQTQGDIRKRTKDTKTWDQRNKAISESETSKFIASLKKCLTDIIKNSKLQLQIDQEEHNKELEFIFSKLAEDRDDIKKTIVQAFTVAAEQAKKNFDQFGHIGQEAMHYIAVLNENTNTMLKTKLEDADGRLKEILNAVKRQNFDVATIKETLENIDGQFDDIFRRVELGCQKNTEHCEEMAQSLEAASNNWVSTASELEKFAEEFSSDAKKMKEILTEMKNIVDYVDAKYVPDINKSKKGKRELLLYEPATKLTTQDAEALSQKEAYLNFMNTLMCSCWEKLSSMNNRVENGCDEICEIVDSLKGKLLSLNESLTKLDDILGNIDLDNLMTYISSARCLDENSEEILEPLLKTCMGDAGDALPQILRQIEDESMNGTQGQKLQNTASLDTEVKKIEFILRKVYEKRYLKKHNNGELVSLNSKSSESIAAKEPRTSTTVANEQKSGDAAVWKQYDAGESQ